MIHRILKAFGPATLAVVLSASANAAVIYSFTSFDGPPDNAGGTTVNGINNNGQIVGFSANDGATALTNFIRNTDGTFTTLATGGDPLAAANGINNSDMVVGGSPMSGTAFLLAGGTLTTLTGAPAPVMAFGINDGGRIVGQASDGTGFLASGGTYTDLNPVPGGLVFAQGVNNIGWVAGFYSNPGDTVHQHAFLFNSGMGTFVFPTDPVVPAGMPAFVFSQFLSINDWGIVAGYYGDATGSQHGFLYDTNTGIYTFMDDPGAAVNDGVAITQITGIADSGEIAGFYIDANGLQRGFLATTSVSPEPATFGLLLGALIPILAVGRRFRSKR